MATSVRLIRRYVWLVDTIRRDGRISLGRWFRLSVSLSAALLINMLVMFTIPTTTTFGIIIKDVISLIIAGIIYFKILKDD